MVLCVLLFVKLVIPLRHLCEIFAPLIVTCLVSSSYLRKVSSISKLKFAKSRDVYRRGQAIEINFLFSTTGQLFCSNIVKTCHASALQKIRTFTGPA